MDFSETIAVCDLKVIELMKTCGFDGQGHLHMKIKLGLLRNHLAIFNKILNVSL